MNNLSSGGIDNPYNYRLPPLVNAVRKSWETTLRNGLILSASLAIVSILFFIAIPTSIMHGRSASDSALQVIAYGSVIFNLSGAIGAFVLGDMLGDMTLTASRGGATPPPERPIASSISILRGHGIRASWTWIMFHWTCLSHIGMLFLGVQIVLSAWLTQATAVKVTLIVFTGIAALPLLAVFVA
ncbi:hypothetical protein C8F04DRAFT_1259576 [Mycena alexandri]|uniref:Uncharacterized protein n=1 Tax=Mycena alexandri TaxID=1745969 RepID=A0AAD6SW26_9AGAR|nr:hypothetical protein C8F04DRAFT_1259576 [Mycena alexandri]